MSVKNMKILVTGASSGIGAHISEFLARQGAQVVLAARRLETLQELAAKCGDNTSALRMDVGDPDSVTAGVAEAAQRMDGLDGLFNNAGVAWGGRTQDMPFDEWDKVMEINVNGAFRAAKAAAEIMMKSRAGGSILNTASILGVRTGLGVAAYSASKAAVVHMTHSLAQEWAPFRVRVNAIAPGYFPSEMTEPFLNTEKGQALKKGVPMRRFGELTELEGPVELLLGSRGSYMTGVILPVDGGHLCRPI
ncbi:MAG: SDR family NAD(P)-dependent oxidoreductase [Paracoccaceae bacterium]